MIEYRSLGKIACLMVMTVGIYGLFWFYWVSKEMLAYNGRKGNPGLWVIALDLAGSIPFIHAIPVWKFAWLVDLTSKGKYNKFFLFAGGLLIVFIPIIMFLTQRLLNEIALEQMARAGGEQPGWAQKDGEQLEGAALADAQPAGEPLEDAAPGAEQADEELPPEPGESAPDDEPDEEPYIKSDDIRTIGT